MRKVYKLFYRTLGTMRIVPTAETCKHVLAYERGVWYLEDGNPVLLLGNCANPLCETSVSLEHYEKNLKPYQKVEGSYANHLRKAHILNDPFRAAKPAARNGLWKKSPDMLAKLG